MLFSRFSRLLLTSATVVVAASLWTACAEDRASVDPPGPELDGREYFPMAVGRFWVYDVVEHHWDFNRDSVSRQQFRERVDTVYQSPTGEITYRLVRSRRADSLAVWRDDSASAVILTADLVRRHTANRSVIELLFPVRAGKTWNPNLFNDQDSTVRTYGAVGAAWALPAGQQFAKTLRVTDEPQISEVFRREQESVYAWGIGCIYRRRVILDYCNQQQVTEGRCQLGSGYIVRGSTREEQLRNWGPR